MRNKSKEVQVLRYRHAGDEGDSRYSAYSFLTSALDESEWSDSRHASLYSRIKTPGTHWIGGWVWLGAGLDTESRGKVTCLYRGSNPCRPIVQTVVRLCTNRSTPTRITTGNKDYFHKHFDKLIFAMVKCGVFCEV
jgi:hypothetical protein